MKNHSFPVVSPVPAPAPSEAAIRDYAFHLYEQSGRVPGRDLDNWLEASDCLRAHAANPAPAGDADPAPTPKFGAEEPGHVHAAAGHARGVKEKTAHTTGHRHS